MWFRKMKEGVESNSVQLHDYSTQDYYLRLVCGEISFPNAV